MYQLTRHTSKPQTSHFFHRHFSDSRWYAARIIKIESALKFVSCIKVWTVLMWFMRSQVNAGNRNATQMGCNLDTKWHILVLIDWEMSPTDESFDLKPFMASGLRCWFTHSQHFTGWIRPPFNYLFIYLFHYFTVTPKTMHKSSLVYQFGRSTGAATVVWHIYVQ